MNSTATDLLTWLVTKIRALGYDVYQGVAPAGAAYPFVTVNFVTSVPSYSLGGDSGIRIDEWAIAISIFCRDRDAANLCIQYDQKIGAAIEGQFNQVQAQTTIMNWDRGETIGPTWVEHENNWMLVANWHPRAYADGTLAAE